MANPKLATTDYVDGEVAKKQGYFADVAVNETSGNRELSLKDATDNVVGKIIAQKEGGVLLKDVATPTEATDGANKGYADNTFANALKGSKRGSVILIDDVSPVTHDMGVKISSNTITDLTAVKVSRCGKNLMPNSYADSSGTSYTGLTFKTNNDGSITVNGSNPDYDAYYWYIPDKTLLLPAGTYTFNSGLTNGSMSTYYVVWKYGDKEIYSNKKPATFTLTKPTLCGSCFCILKGKAIDGLTIYPQIEIGTVATEYEPSARTEYTPTADGTVNGVTSLYPNTTLMTDTKSAIIDCEYNKDINKFGDLTEYVKHTDIDQTYSPTSENAQSGKAVAEALAAFGGEYELIETITLEEAVTTITRNTEPSGKAYSFKDVFIEFFWNTACTAKWILLEISAGVKKAEAFRDLMQGSGTSWVQILNCYGKRLFLFSNRSSNTAYAQYGAQIPIKYLDSNKPIDTLKIQYQMEMPVGTVIKIWGVRA